MSNVGAVVIKPDGSRLFGLDAELYLKMEAKRDREWEASVGDWIVAVTGQPLADKTDFYVSLKSGVALCQVVNALRPGTISKVANSSHALVQMGNIQQYLTACWELGVPSTDLFIVSDLSKASNIPQVLQSVYSLSQLAPKLGWTGPTIPNQIKKHDGTSSAPAKKWDPVVTAPKKQHVDDFLKGDQKIIQDMQLQMAEQNNELRNLKAENISLRDDLIEQKQRVAKLHEQLRAAKSTTVVDGAQSELSEFKSVQASLRSRGQSAGSKELTPSTAPGGGSTGNDVDYKKLLFEAKAVMASMKTDLERERQRRQVAEACVDFIKRELDQAPAGVTSGELRASIDQAVAKAVKQGAELGKQQAQFAGASGTSSGASGAANAVAAAAAEDQPDQPKKKVALQEFIIDEGTDESSKGGGGKKHTGFFVREEAGESYDAVTMAKVYGLLTRMLSERVVDMDEVVSVMELFVKSDSGRRLLSFVIRRVIDKITDQYKSMIHTLEVGIKVWFLNKKGVWANRLMKVDADDGMLYLDKDYMDLKSALTVKPGKETAVFDKDKTSNPKQCFSVVLLTARGTQETLDFRLESDSQRDSVVQVLSKLRDQAVMRTRAMTGNNALCLGDNNFQCMCYLINAILREMNMGQSQDFLSATVLMEAAGTISTNKEGRHEYIQRVVAGHFTSLPLRFWEDYFWRRLTQEPEMELDGTAQVGGDAWLVAKLQEFAPDMLYWGVDRATIKAFMKMMHTSNNIKDPATLKVLCSMVDMLVTPSEDSGSGEGEMGSPVRRGSVFFKPDNTPTKKKDKSKFDPVAEGATHLAGGSTGSTLPRPAQNPGPGQTGGTLPRSAPGPTPAGGTLSRPSSSSGANPGTLTKNSAVLAALGALDSPPPTTNAAPSNTGSRPSSQSVGQTQHNSKPSEELDSSGEKKKIFKIFRK